MPGKFVVAVIVLAGVTVSWFSLRNGVQDEQDMPFDIVRAGASVAIWMSIAIDEESDVGGAVNYVVDVTYVVSNSSDGRQRIRLPPSRIFSFNDFSFGPSDQGPGFLSGYKSTKEASNE